MGHEFCSISTKVQLMCLFTFPIFFDLFLRIISNKLILAPRNRMFGYPILLCLLLFTINTAYGGATNETSNPVVLRSGPILQEFGDDVPRAAAQISIRDCLCQCHWQTFRDRYGKTHGNCKRNGIRPRIGENQETVGKFRDPEDGAIKKGNQFIPFDSVITLLGARPKPSKGQNIPQVAPPTTTQTTTRESDRINSNTQTSSESNNIDDDAVVFG